MQRPLLVALLFASGLAALLLSACGGSSDSASAPYTATPGNDNEYVAAVCKAQAQLQDAMGAALKDPSKLGNTADFGKLYEQPFEKYIGALRDAHPPSDLVKYHESLVQTLGGIVESMKKSKQISTLVEQASKIPQPPADAAHRLQAVASSNADCQRSGFSFTGGQG